MKLAELTWPEVEKLNRDVVVIYPIAALEQHGRHLPFFTDSILCEAVATRIEAVLKPHTLLLPVQWLGASEHHLGMAGTLTAGVETHLRIICEPLRCLLRAGFKKIFIINGHGGNTDGFHLALRQLSMEYPDAFLTGACYWDMALNEIASLLDGNLKTVGHACEFETSLMMHLRPDLVHAPEIGDDALLPDYKVLPGVFMPLNMKRQTHHGGNGQATCATPGKGKALLKVIVSKAVEVVKTIKARP